MSNITTIHFLKCILMNLHCTCVNIYYDNDLLLGMPKVLDI